jgi:hypothetical protein
MPPRAEASPCHEAAIVAPAVCTENYCQSPGMLTHNVKKRERDRHRQRRHLQQGVQLRVERRVQRPGLCGHDLSPRQGRACERPRRAPTFPTGIYTILIHRQRRAGGRRFPGVLAT